MTQSTGRQDASAPHVEALLEARELSVGYGGPQGTTIISGLDFSVRAGEFVSIVGPSGVGKTTLLRTLSGLLEPTAGSLTFEGRPVIGPPDHLALVFQDYSRSLLPWATNGKNVELVLRRRGMAHSERRERAVSVLEAVGLNAAAAGKYPWELSGGMQQRVSIARALAYEPRVLLMDEAFGSVDALTRVGLEDLVLRVRAQFDMTVLLVTHDIDEAIYMSDRVIVLGGAPASVIGSVDIPFEGDRDQFATKALPVFAELRHEIYEHVQSGVPTR